MGKLPKNRPNQLAGLPKTQIPVPRSMAEISEENAKLCAHAGTIQYQIYVLERDLDQTNQSIMNANYEAAARQKLDAEAKKEEV